MTVAILDTGIDGRHREFAHKSILEVDLTGGQITPSAFASDENGHGTYLAGIIAGQSLGIAPDVDLVSVRVLSPHGSGVESTVLAGLNWVVDQPDVCIVVLSLGFEGSAGIWKNEITFLLDLNILPVIAAGNRGLGRVTSPGNTFGGLVVGSSTRDGLVADFSGSARLTDKGRRHTVPDLVAPGVDIFSTVPGDRYATWNGTTPSTAIVAGVAALVREKYPKWSARQVREHILDHCQALDAPAERRGRGLVRIEAAL